MTNFSGIGGPNFSGPNRIKGTNTQHSVASGQNKTVLPFNNGPLQDEVKLSGGLPAPIDYKGLTQAAAKFASGLPMDEAAKHQHGTTHLAMSKLF